MRRLMPQVPREGGEWGSRASCWRLGTLPRLPFRVSDMLAPASPGCASAAQHRKAKLERQIDRTQIAEAQSTWSRCLIAERTDRALRALSQQGPAICGELAAEQTFPVNPVIPMCCEASLADGVSCISRHGSPHPEPGPWIGSPLPRPVLPPPDRPISCIEWTCRDGGA